MAFACNLLGAFKEGIVDVFGTRYLGLDHTEVLRVRQAFGLYCVRLGCCGDEVWRMLGTVDALRQALVREPLGGKITSERKTEHENINGNAAF